MSVCACVCARACKNIGYARAHPKIQRSRTLIRNTLEHSGSLNFRCVRAFIQVAQTPKKRTQKVKYKQDKEKPRLTSFGSTNYY
jgi:hypothetical protein